MREEISNHSVVYMQGEFKLLYNAIEGLSVNQKLGRQLNDQIKELIKVKNDLVQQNQE